RRRRAPPAAPARIAERLVRVLSGESRLPARPLRDWRSAGNRDGARGHRDAVPPRHAEARRADRQTLPQKPEGTVVIEVEGLTVHFGGVTPLDDVTVSFLEGTCG